MSRAALLLVLPMMLACTPAEETPMADTPAVTAEAPAPLNYAGNWTVTNMPEGRDTVLVTYDMVATNDQSGWSLSLPGRPVLRPRVVSISADSVVLELDPFESVLRPGQMVTTHTVFRMEGDRLVGTTIARYPTGGADSVTVLRTTATRR
jgi:hypothetical protein